MSIEHIHFRNITLPVFVCISPLSEIHQQMTLGYKTYVYSLTRFSPLSLLPKDPKGMSVNL